MSDNLLDAAMEMVAGQTSENVRLQRKLAILKQACLALAERVDKACPLCRGSHRQVGTGQGKRFFQPCPTGEIHQIAAELRKLREEK